MARKIRILFDAEPLITVNKSGVGYYTEGLMTAIASIDPANIMVIGHCFNFLGLKSQHIPDIPNISFKVTRSLPRQIPYALRRIGLPIPYELLAKEQADVFIYPGFIGFPSAKNALTVPVIHDLTYLDHPDLVSRQNQLDLQRLMPKTLRSASLTLTVSDYSADRIRHHYPWFDKPIIVGHIPPPLPTQPDTSTLSLFGIRQPYILFVGTIEPRKNIQGLLTAYRKLPPAVRSKYALVLAGGTGWHHEPINTAIGQAKASGLNIIQTGYVTDAQKSALFQNASLLVHASKYEGYGMPLLEAMQHNLPMTVSDIPVFRKVAGNAALYASPEDSAAFADAIKRALLDTATRNQLHAAATEILESVSWNGLAKKVLHEINNVL